MAEHQAAPAGGSINKTRPTKEPSAKNSFHVPALWRAQPNNRYRHHIGQNHMLDTIFIAQADLSRKLSVASARVNERLIRATRWKLFLLKA